MTVPDYTASEPGTVGHLSRSVAEGNTRSVDLQLVSAVAFPFLMVIGGIAAWRMSKKETTRIETPAWRDDSLDDWRKERDARAEQARAIRPSDPTHLSTGSEEQQETTKRHQRLGG